MIQVNKDRLTCSTDPVITTYCGKVDAPWRREEDEDVLSNDDENDLGRGQGHEGEGHHQKHDGQALVEALRPSCRRCPAPATAGVKRAFTPQRHPVVVDDEDVEDEEQREGQEGVEGGVNPWPDVVQEVPVLILWQTAAALRDGGGEEEVEVFGDADDSNGGGDDTGVTYGAHGGSLEGVAYGDEPADRKTAE